MNGVRSVSSDHKTKTSSKPNPPILPLISIQLPHTIAQGIETPNGGTDTPLQVVWESQCSPYHTKGMSPNKTSLQKFPLMWEWDNPKALMLLQAPPTPFSLGKTLSKLTIALLFVS